MKKLFTILTIFLLVTSCAQMEATRQPTKMPTAEELQKMAEEAGAIKVRAFVNRTGGTNTDLNGIGYSSLTEDDIGIVVDEDILYIYQFEDAAGTEENPYLIRAKDYSTSGIWNLANAHFGEILGRIDTTEDSDGNNSVTKSECDGSIYVNSGANTYILPEVAAGMSICFYNRTAATMIIDVDGSDEIVLDGADLTAGYTIENTSAAAGDFVCLHGLDAVHWLVWGSSGTWADGGES
jgi:hypothetical protein